MINKFQALALLAFATLALSAPLMGQTFGSGPNILPKGCSCTGTGCKCSCSGSGCNCSCDGGKCVCLNTPVREVSLAPGTTVQAVADTLSGVLGRKVLVFSGAAETIPASIQDTTPWQALARMAALPGVRLGVEKKELGEAFPLNAASKLRRSLQQQANSSPGAGTSAAEASSSTQATSAGLAEGSKEMEEVRRLPSAEVVSICAYEATLPAVLDGLSRISGAAFEVEGAPSGKLTLRAKGTVSEVVNELSSPGRS